MTTKAFQFIIFSINLFTLKLFIIEDISFIFLKYRLRSQKFSFHSLDPEAQQPEPIWVEVAGYLKNAGGGNQKNVKDNYVYEVLN